MPDTDHHEDATMPHIADATEVHPRPLRAREVHAPRFAAGVDDPTRLDVQAAHLFEVGEPTVVTAFDPENPDRARMTVRQRVRVSPIGTHTVGAAATTPPDGMPALADPVRARVARINAALDERDEREHRRAGRPPVRSLREVALQRAEGKARHERHLEALETVRAYLVLLIVFCLLLIVVGAAVVGWGILDGWFAWQPVLNR